MKTTNAYPDPVKLEEFMPVDIEKFRNKMSFKNREAWSKAMKREMDVIQEGERRLMDIDALAIKSGGLLYRAIITPRGDGCAMYQVIKVGSRSCTIKHIALGGDDWQEPRFGDGGSFPLSVIKHYL